jgi:D-tyrosyl-tRNA(Tyr) deacylase
MRAVIQRVARARVVVDSREVAAIGAGALVLLGVARGDGTADALRLADKTARLRIFDDAEGRMNLDARAVGGAFLVVSQFTLLADCRKGHRPSYIDAAPPETAAPLYEAFAARLREQGFGAPTGVFGAAMRIELVHDGPVTIILETSPHPERDSP